MESCPNQNQKNQNHWEIANIFNQFFINKVSNFKESINAEDLTEPLANLEKKMEKRRAGKNPPPTFKLKTIKKSA